MRGDRRGAESEAKSRGGGHLALEVFAQAAKEGRNAKRGEGDHGVAGFGFEGKAAGGYADYESDAANAGNGDGVGLAADGESASRV